MLVTDHVSAMLAYWDRSQVCRFANAAYTDWLGKSLKQLVGTHTLKELLGTLYAENQHHITGVLEGITQEFELEIPEPKNKSSKWFLAKYHPHIINGKIEGFITHIADITVLKNKEEQIAKLNATLEQRVEERTKKMEFAIKELESFSYSVSHDLRAPLRAVSGFGNILRNDYYDSLNADAKECVDTIVRNANRMGQLIDDILAFSRLGKSEIRKQTVNMTMLFQEVFNELMEGESDRNIELDLGNLKTAEGDKSMLKQVVSNLLSNAIKYTRYSNPSTIKVSGRKKGDEYIYTIKDNGVGFSNAYKHKLFEVFQRLHKSSKFEGTGVGLATVHRIINRHGGKVWGNGTVNKGASFYFTLK